MSVKENNAIMERDLDIFLSESEEDAKVRRNKYCKRCVYRASDINRDKNGKDMSYTGGCSYITRTGHMRPCAPSDCYEKGIFVRRKPEKGYDAKEHPLVYGYKHKIYEK
jgi:hypothetical protein